MRRIAPGGRMARGPTQRWRGRRKGLFRRVRPARVGCRTQRHLLRRCCRAQRPDGSCDRSKVIGSTHELMSPFMWHSAAVAEIWRTKGDCDQQLKLQHERSNACEIVPVAHAPDIESETVDLSSIAFVQITESGNEARSTAWLPGCSRIEHRFGNGTRNGVGRRYGELGAAGRNIVHGRNAGTLAQALFLRPRL